MSNIRVRAQFELSLTPLSLSAPADKLRLKYLFPDWKTNDGLFDKMGEVPWQDVVGSEHLNRLYFGFHSGFKRPSPYLEEFIQASSLHDFPYAISEQDMNLVATDIMAMYREKWEHLFELYVMRIDPLNNFHWVETHKRKTLTDTDRSLSTDYGRTDTDTTTQSTTDTRTGNVTDNTNFLGTVTSEKAYTGTEKEQHDATRNLETGTKETNSDTNTRTGSVGETGHTARYGFDSLATGEGEPYDRSAGNTTYNNLTDNTQKTHLSSVTETGTDGYTEEKTFTNRKDTDTQSFDGRADNNTVTYNNVKDQSESDSSKSHKSGGTDSSTEDKVVSEEETSSDEMNGYRDVNYFEQLRKAFKAYEKAFFDVVFADVDALIARGMY